MIRKMAAPGLDPGMETGFSKRLCSKKTLGRQSILPKRLRDIMAQTPGQHYMQLSRRIRERSNIIAALESGRAV
jgi:hypothetical protein